MATISPFMGLLLMLISLRGLLLRSGGKILSRALLWLVFPVLLGSFTLRQPGSLLIVSDAVFGAGLVSLLYLYSLTRQGKPAMALVHGAILVIVYGALRFFLFRTQLIAAHDLALAEMNKLVPQMMQLAKTQNTLAITRLLLPASWTVTQLLALTAGHLAFLHLSGVRSILREFSLPAWYNLLILAVLPLYFIPPLREVLVNTLLALCFLPLVQGIGVILNWFSRLVSNPLVTLLVIALALLNLILVALLGFADTWLDFRKIRIKGTYA
ncbi:MAG TPA: hypothetical protein PKK86_06555 [Candidatus Syntrophosphaera sp.]|jgi:hypothetical protein|nr:hypothetical protein [Candidatus Syntrophosphaera sp.]